MPNYLQNWNFNDVTQFLEQHFFLLRNVASSHFYFRGLVDKEWRLCHVQRHPHETIHPKTLKQNIIIKSGIPLEIWTKWGMSNNQQRKKIQYSGAQAWQP